MPPDLPDRARRFCPPVRVPYEQGALFFSPVDFDFRVRSEGVDLRFLTDGGGVYERTIAEHGYVLIPDVSTSWDQECRSLYRDRLAEEPLPRNFDRDDPDYPQHLVEVTREQGPREFGYVLSVWIGMVIVLEPGHKLLVKDPSHTQMIDRGYRFLDAVVESDRWHGNIGMAFRAHRHDTWLRVRRAEPLFQALVYWLAEDRLEHTELAGVPQDRILDPLRWNAFDPYRRNALRIGKYQSELRRLPAWDCDWQPFDRQFAERKATLGPDTELSLTMTPRLEVDAQRVRVIFSAEDEFEVEGPELRAFATGLGRATARFTTTEALRWSQAGAPDGPRDSEIVEHLRTLIWHGLLTVTSRR